MKQYEIKQCTGCNKGVLHDQSLMFYTVDIKYHMADLGAIERQAGMEAMMGGSAVLAQVLGPDADITKELVAMKGLWVCLDCSLKLSVAELMELAQQKEDADAAAKTE